MTDVVELTEVIVPGPAVALAGLLGVPLPDLDAGEGLPPLWHWVYLLDRAPQADLGPDGHAVRGVVPVPPAPGRRRMWAGGLVRTFAPLRCGETATRSSRVVGTRDTVGRSGSLTFVTAEHVIRQRGEVVVHERQELLYREPAAPRVEVEPDTAVHAAAGDRAIEVTPSLLFRFSALTYNGHRIHYDRDYARDVEGYPGLVVHGPLQALAMAEAGRAAGARGAGTFEYRLVAPLFDFQGMVARADATAGGFTTSVRDRAGRQTARGTLTSSPPAAA